MKAKLKLGMLACALAASSIAGAQTSSQTNIPPPNDIIRLPRSVTTPDMPIVVDPPREDLGRAINATPGDNNTSASKPVIRSLGSGSNGADALGNGATIGNGSTFNVGPSLNPGATLGGGSTLGVGSGLRSGATLGNGTTGGGSPSPAIPGESVMGTVNESVNGSTTSGGSGGPTDIGGVNGATSSAGLNGGITPSSGGVSGAFGSNGVPIGNAGTATGPNGANSDNGSGGAVMAPSGSITVPGNPSGALRGNGSGAARGSGAVSGGK
jgi:hypothetical protein